MHAEWLLAARYCASLSFSRSEPRRKARVHAYVGPDLFGGGLVPADATAVASLHSYLVLTFDAIYGRYAAGSGDGESRCAAAGRTLRALAPGGADFVPYPYPVTPYHAD